MMGSLVFSPPQRSGETALQHRASALARAESFCCDHTLSDTPDKKSDIEARSILASKSEYSFSLSRGRGSGSAAKKDKKMQSTQINFEDITFCLGHFFLCLCCGGSTDAFVGLGVAFPAARTRNSLANYGA